MKQKTKDYLTKELKLYGRMILIWLKILLFALIIVGILGYFGISPN
jgi:hypothetical protein